MSEGHKLNNLVSEVKAEYGMKEVNPIKKFGQGVNLDGEKITIAYVNHLFCERKNLVKLDVPELCKSLYCEGNFLTEIQLQHTMVEVWCYQNQLTELHVPIGVEDLRCENNNLTSLEVPSTVDWLTCDKELFDYSTCTVKRVNIIY